MGKSITLSPVLIRLLAFAVAALVCYGSANLLARFIENRSEDAVSAQLTTDGYEWASVVTDGLQVILQGEAPSEAIRLRARSSAASVVEPGRVIDNMTVADRNANLAPDFAIEILRNDDGISIIGLAPASTDRDALAEKITEIADGKPVTDLLNVAVYPSPETWKDALDFGIVALERLENAKISVMSDRVSITAITDDEAQKNRIESTLLARRPEDVRIAMQIRAPLPVISPYLTRVTKSADALSFDACVADTPEAIDEISEAARSAGYVGRSPCVLGLGSPSPQWGTAVTQSINALSELESGSVTLSDTDIDFLAGAGTPSSKFDNVVGQLSNSLPEIFSLNAQIDSSEAAAQAPASFSATLSPEGDAQLRGRVTNEMMNTTLESYAKARFGADNVTMGTRPIPDGLPVDWSLRVLAGVEALSKLGNGSVTVTPETVTVTGTTGLPDGKAQISSILVKEIGSPTKFDIDVTYDEAFDPYSGLPSAEECVAQISALTEAQKIVFDPGSSTISATSKSLLDEIAEILRSCHDLKMEIAGYTDSQGGDDMNARLSQSRADAVLAALRLRRVPTRDFDFVAVGYGEADPIASNDTSAGREANRRIEFHLIVDETTETANDDAEPQGEESAETTGETESDGLSEGAPTTDREDAAPEDEEDVVIEVVENPGDEVSRPTLRPDTLETSN